MEESEGESGMDEVDEVKMDEGSQQGMYCILPYDYRGAESAAAGRSELFWGCTAARNALNGLIGQLASIPAVLAWSCDCGVLLYHSPMIPNLLVIV